MDAEGVGTMADQQGFMIIRSMIEVPDDQTVAAIIYGQPDLPALDVAEIAAEIMRREPRPAMSGHTFHVERMP